MNRVIRSFWAIVLGCMTSHAAENLALPDVLRCADGKIITAPEQWRNVRRPEILELFRSNVYGRAPVDRPNGMRFLTMETAEPAMSGRATRKMVDINFSGPGGTGVIHLVLFIPNNVPKPVPGFLMICNRQLENIDASRKTPTQFWPAEKIVERGYVAAAFYNTDLDPDQNDGFKDGVHGIFDRKDVPRSPDAWGSVGAWAWGASRVMDYFETDRDIDAKRIAVVGHSRCGKAALWCGAQDERFAAVIGNGSGCTGAALSRQKKGETIKAINSRFPHWFCANYKRYNDKENELPIDQHELLSLMAPRLVYVASAEEDAWADPQGEFQSCVYADPVYRLFGLAGLNAKTMPKVNQPLLDGTIGYHIRPGKHDLTEYDWKCFMDFTDKHWNHTMKRSAP